MMGMEVSIQAIFREHFEAYAQSHRLPVHQRRAARALIACRTAALGGHVQACPEGHVERVWYNSCKHRVCPQCNQIQIERWLAFQQARLLSCAHHHLIFTLPHELNALWMGNTAVMTGLLFRAVRDTLMELTRDERYLGAEPGFLLTLHTWGRSLSLHPHIHCLITDGGLDGEGHWVKPKKSCFLPARVVMALFRGKFLSFLQRAEAGGALRLPLEWGQGDFQALLSKLYRTKYNVHLQERYPHGEGVVKYLARYVRGGALKNRQIQKLTEEGITYRFYAHGAGGKPTEMTVSPEEFFRRYLQHVPAHRRQVVRSFGLYAHTKTAALNRARAGQGQPPIERPPFSP
ncbi:MAG: IS91 family transposase, partial [Candidatus Methylomirabilales bacterium]